MYSFKVCRSTDITQSEWEQITEGFNKSFERNITPEKLSGYYRKNFLGYSYHVICQESDSNKIIGSTSVFPYYYNVNSSENVLIGLSGGSFIRPEYRTDLVLYRKMFLQLRSYCSNEGLKAIIGIPNKNLFLYTTKLLSFQYLFDLPYLIFPVNIFRLINLDFTSLYNLTKWIFKSYLRIIKIPFNFINERAIRKKIYINNKWDFYSVNYDDSYTFVKTKSFSGLYRCVNEKGKNVAYIFDYESFDAKSTMNMIDFLLNIISNNKVDLIAYIGTKRFNKLIFFSLPVKMIPKRLPFTIDILDNEFKSELLTSENWEFGLANFDVR